MNLKESVKPVSYLKSNAARIIKDSLRHPVSYVITQRGKACLVVQDVASWEKMRKSVAMLRILLMGEQDVAAGRVTSLNKAFAEVRRKLQAAC